jgi:DNA (cytosine-5)-methyltransferase 1
MTITAAPAHASFASLFSGIAGLDLGLHRRMPCTLMVEVEEHPRTILSRHFPNTPLMKDVCNVNGRDLRRPTVLVAGFPCKDTSIAGGRTGLHGARSGLFFEIMRLIDEAEERPEWVIIENPDGALTSNNGRDWLTVTRDLERRGYGWAYRVVDARDLGSPQKRTRVLLVGHRSGDATLAGEVLGLCGPGGETVAAPAVPAGQDLPRPHRDGGPARGEVTVWRKSARAQKKIELGGWESWVPATHANTLTCFDGPGTMRQTHLLRQDGRLRALTMTEWERLCGFPDGWTEGIPEGARSTALGNCVHVSMGEWLAEQLCVVMQRLAATSPAAATA